MIIEAHLFAQDFCAIFAPLGTENPSGIIQYNPQCIMAGSFSLLWMQSLTGRQKMRKKEKP